jgi:SAM-dependent methyltransferase
MGASLPVAAASPGYDPPVISAADAPERFTGRAGDYVRGRPGYPEALFDRLLERTGLAAGAVVADLGAGTGIASEPLLRRGLRVAAVEPNAAMRAAAVERLGAAAGFRATAGTAEATGLGPASVDLALAAQAFHWFDPDRACLEQYETLLVRFGTDYAQVGHRGIGTERIAAFFGGRFEHHRFDNAQLLDREGLQARLLSSSYVPARGAPGHDEMLAELERIFLRHQRDGRVRIDYDVDLFLGTLDGHSEPP